MIRVGFEAVSDLSDKKVNICLYLFIYLFICLFLLCILFPSCAVLIPVCSVVFIRMAFEVYVL